MCTPGDAAANGREIGSIGAGHLDNREVQVAPFRVLLAFFAFLFAHTYIADNRGVEGMAPKLQLESPAEGAREEAPKEPAEAAPKDTAKQPAEMAKRKALKQPAEAAPTKESKPQAPKEAPKQPPEAAPTEPQTPQEDWEWLQPGVFIPGLGPDCDDSSSAGHGAHLLENEIAELADVKREAFKKAGPPPGGGADWGIPKTCGIAPIGRSWQNRTWRALYSEEYCTAAEEAAGKMTKDGRPVDFYVTTARDRRTHENAPMAHFYSP